MVALKRLWWLIFNWRRQFTIHIDPDAKAAYIDELKSQYEQLSRHAAYQPEAEREYFGALILVSAMNLLAEGTLRYYCLRAASEAEYADAANEVRGSGNPLVTARLDDSGGIKTLFADGDTQLVFHFFERYGYRFTLLVNLNSYQGKVYHVERLRVYRSGATGIAATLASKNL